MSSVIVITPTLAFPTFLHKGIDSVVTQSYNDIELIVVDDNELESLSRKVTENLVKSLVQGEFCIKYVQHSRNRNDAFNNHFASVGYSLVKLFLINFPVEFSKT